MQAEPVESPAPAAQAPVASSEPALADGAKPEPKPASICDTVPFPPKDFAPPHERSAQPGDGKWKRLGTSGRDRVGSGPDVMYVSVVHPHPVSKWQSVTTVAIDLCRTSLHLVAGTDEPKSDNAPEGSRLARVPEAEQARLLAVLNGGYKTSHGKWGMMTRGHVFVEPRPEGCTLAIGRNGDVRIAPWPKLSGRTDELAAYRQTPPCLLDNGQLHEKLEAKNERAWGGRDPKRKTRRRSAMGVDKSGRILFYGFGEEVGPRMLAEGLRHAGVTQAAQFDINYSWTRFLLFGKSANDDELKVTSTLVPKMVHRKRGYVGRDEPRDFFYVLASAGQNAGAKR